MRTVQVYKPGLVGGPRTPDYIGMFHKWGVDYEELNDGVGTYSVAIVELDDGQIRLPYASMVQFINPSDLWTQSEIDDAIAHAEKVSKLLQWGADELPKDQS